MHDDTAQSGPSGLYNIDNINDIERLLPPHTTEYRSGSVLAPLPGRYEEPATLPDLPAVGVARARVD